MEIYQTYEKNRDTQVFTWEYARSYGKKEENIADPGPIHRIFLRNMPDHEKSEIADPGPICRIFLGNMPALFGVPI